MACDITRSHPICGHPPTSIPDLVKSAKDIWRKVIPEHFSRLALSLSNRMQVVKKGNGGNTSY